jgi:gamma-glutamylcyclotransferase (GGCT)/AIG2-like uncharacterized protein YtfP
MILFVNGTLMRGLALHGNLAGAEFLGEARTAPRYRLHSIGDRHPGMYELDEGGVAVEGELYEMSDEIWRRVEAGEPPGLYRASRPSVRWACRGWHPLSARARGGQASGYLRSRRLARVPCVHRSAVRCGDGRYRSGYPSAALIFSFSA